MNCKLEKDQEQRLRHRIVYSCIRRYGVEDVAEMMGLTESQTSLIYKYSNCMEVNVPNKRWRMLSQGLTLKKDTSIVREYTDPSVLVSLTAPGDTDGKINDQIENISIAIGKILERLQDGGTYDVRAIQELAETIANESATMKKELS